MIDWLNLTAQNIFHRFLKFLGLNYLNYDERFDNYSGRICLQLMIIKLLMKLIYCCCSKIKRDSYVPRPVARRQKCRLCFLNRTFIFFLEKNSLQATNMSRKVAFILWPFSQHLFDNNTFKQKVFTFCLWHIIQSFGTSGILILCLWNTSGSCTANKQYFCVQPGTIWWIVK